MSSCLCQLSFTLLTQTAIAANFFFHQFCSVPENSSASFPLGTNHNLNILLDHVNATAPTGYGYVSVPSLYPGPHPPSYALALCRGEVNVTTCQACLADARTEIRRASQKIRVCLVYFMCLSVFVFYKFTEFMPLTERGLIWYDDCLLKYSDVNFFGNIDNTIKFYMWEFAADVGDILVGFNEKRGDFLSQLSEEASVAPKMYAAGELELEGGMKMNGMVQCTRDLSSYDCKKCLDGILCELDRRFDGTRRAKLFGGSCFIDYQIIYPTFASAKAIA